MVVEACTPCSTTLRAAGGSMHRCVGVHAADNRVAVPVARQGGSLRYGCGGVGGRVHVRAQWLCPVCALLLGRCSAIASTWSLLLGSVH